MYQKRVQQLPAAQEHVVDTPAGALFASENVNISGGNVLVVNASAKANGGQESGFLSVKCEPVPPLEHLAALAVLRR